MSLQSPKRHSTSRWDPWQSQLTPYRINERLVEYLVIYCTTVPYFRMCRPARNAGSLFRRSAREDPPILGFASLHRVLPDDHRKRNGKMQSGTGIQELMAAETRASQIVAEARIGKFPVKKERQPQKCHRQRGTWSSRSEFSTGRT